MQFIKKLVFGLGACILILSGGAGTQSKNILLQGGGFISLIIGLVVLYLFVKMAWRAMGCLPSFLIFSGIVIFILYAIGAFKNGIGGVGANLRSFMGQGGAVQNAPPASGIDNHGIVMLNADYEPENPAAQMAEEMPQSGAIQGFVNNISEKFSASPRSAGMENLPTVTMPVRVIKGDTLNLQGHYFRLYGIEAPDLDQSCADHNGRSYKCGVKAASWLRDWIGDTPLECRIMQQDARGNMAGTCSFGPYDLGAALVNAGWALAQTKYTGIYAPYELQARTNRRGLWSGTFYRPSDWRILKAQQPKIKVIKPKVKKKSRFGF